jgi:hypothetical protein
VSLRCPENYRHKRAEAFFEKEVLYMKVFYALLFGTMFFTAAAGVVNAQTVLTSAQASNVLEIEDLKMTPSRVSGVVTNRSPHTVKDVELVVQHHWLWQDEFNPGQDSPGRVATIRLRGPVGPGQSVSFDYTPLAGPSVEK